MAAATAALFVARRAAAGGRALLRLRQRRRLYAGAVAGAVPAGAIPRALSPPAIPAGAIASRDGARKEALPRWRFRGLGCKQDWNILATIRQISLHIALSV